MAWLRVSSALSCTALLSLAALTGATKHDVKVGAGGQLKFDPEILDVQVGDEITYHFFAKDGGSFSGFTPTESPDAEAPTTWTIKVNDTKPIWIYCGQGDHCQKGMVQAINAPAEGNTFDKYKELAAKAGPSSSPPDGLPIGGVRKLHIDVGFDGKLVFNPSNVQELPGTRVEFSFNPANHSVVQSSFDDPCHPLEKGFSSPFVPTKDLPSGVTFEIDIVDTKPIWWYCAQTAKTHCQAGMVGSINAALEGDKTFEAFKALAAKASPSTIQPIQPNVGFLRVNGTQIQRVNGAVLDVIIEEDPTKVDYKYDGYMESMAGGGAPANYQWAPSISDNATDALQRLQYIDNFLLSVLWHGQTQLTRGSWAGLYPQSIVHTISSMFAQALIQRSTYTDSLKHFSKPLVEPCDDYDLQSDSIDDWLQTSLTALTLSLGSLMDVIAKVTDQDHWMIAALSTQIGAKARMIAVVNLMQNHLAATAPREVLIPVELAVSYVKENFAKSGDDSCGADYKTWTPLEVKDRQVMQGGSGRATGVTVKLPGEGKKYYMAWIGPWGSLRYSDVDADGKTVVPEELSGHVWGMLVTERDGGASEIAGVATAGPFVMWVADPWQMV